MRTFIFIASLLLLGACRTSAPAEEFPTLLRVGSDLDNSPFAYLDPEGEPGGRDVEMMKLLAEDLGVELTWVRMPFGELLPALERGDVDVVCATLGVTEARAQRVAFSRPYFHTRLLVVVRDGLGEPRTLGGLAGRTVSAGKGTTSQAAVLRGLPEAVGEFENKSGLLTLERLLAGEIDAAVMDGPAARTLVEGAGGRLRILEEDLGTENYALAVGLGRPDVKQRVEAGVLRMQQNGTLRSLDGEWGLSVE